MLKEHAKSPFDIKKPQLKFVTSLDHGKKKLQGVQEHGCAIFARLNLKAAIPRLNPIIKINQE